MHCIAGGIVVYVHPCRQGEPWRVPQGPCVLWCVPVTAKWLTPCWETETGSATLKNVLMVLADHADEDGVAWPRVTSIMRKAELSESSVRRAVKDLEDRGLIHVVEMFGPKGVQIQNAYKLLVDPRNSAKKQYSPVSLTGGEGVTLTPLGVSHSQGEGVTVTPPTRTPIRTPTEVKDFRSTASNRRGTVAARAADHDHDDEAPAHGADPDRQQPAPAARTKRPMATDRRAKIERAAQQRGSAYGHACHMLVELEGRGQPKPVNIAGLTKTLNGWLADGVTLPTIGKMIDLFLSSPEAYTHGDKVAWIAFQGARVKLQADAEKVRRSNAPAREHYADPYASVR